MLLQTTMLDALHFLTYALVHLLVLSSDLFARTGRKMTGDDSIVGTVKLGKLDNELYTSTSLS